jgi:hypothetical protein
MDKGRKPRAGCIVVDKHRARQDSEVPPRRPASRENQSGDTARDTISNRLLWRIDLAQ